MIKFLKGHACISYVHVLPYSRTQCIRVTVNQDFLWPSIFTTLKGNITFKIILLLSLRRVFVVVLLIFIVSLASQCIPISTWIFANYTCTTEIHIFHVLVLHNKNIHIYYVTTCTRKSTVDIPYQETNLALIWSGSW